MPDVLQQALQTAAADRRPEDFWLVLTEVRCSHCPFRLATPAFEACTPLYTAGCPAGTRASEFWKGQKLLSVRAHCLATSAAPLGVVLHRRLDANMAVGPATTDCRHASCCLTCFCSFLHPTRTLLCPLSTAILCAASAEEAN